MIFNHRFSRYFIVFAQLEYDDDVIDYFSCHALVEHFAN